MRSGLCAYGCYPDSKHIPAKAKPWANEELFSKVANFIDLHCGQRFPVLDEDNIVDFLVKTKEYNRRLLQCMAKGKTVDDLNGLFARWFSPRLDASLRKSQEELLKLLEDGYDKIKMEAYVHLLREASELNLFKKAKPMSNRLYLALSAEKGKDDEAFPISGVSFNKYFRNPDFCEEAKWKEAAKVLKAVHAEYI